MASGGKRKGSPCAQDDNSQSGKKLRSSGPSLPEDIWRQIHSLLPLQDAGRVACVSRSFRRSWRCYPNIIITRETLGLENEMSYYKVSIVLARITNQILKTHSGVGVKALKLQISDFPLFSTSTDVDRWLHIAVKPGIEKLDLCLSLHSRDAAAYDFPCPLLLNGSGKSIQHLHLRHCAFRPTAGLGCLRSLTSLGLYSVRITCDELRYLLSSSVTLVKLSLVSCNELIFLEIPSLLQHLSHLYVSNCNNLKVIESRAPNLYSFRHDGSLIGISLGDSLQNFKFFDSSLDVFHYACKDHPHMVPNLEALDISSYVWDTLVVPVPSKFLQLRRLRIGLISPDYDFLSLVPFLDACPSLETFMLFVDPVTMEQESVLGNFPHDQRQMPGHLHRNIKDVQISVFCSSRSMVELTYHILESAKSLERLTLSTISNGDILCCNSKNGRCIQMSKDMITEARKAIMVIKRYIVEKVPSSVELKVVKPCRQCNPLEV